MQLNNTTTGHSILIDKVDINLNRIVYSEYEIKNNEISYLTKQSSYIFKDIVLKDKLSESTNFEELSLTQLKTELVLDDYELSTDSQNWLFPNRLARVIIMSSFVLKELQPIDNTGTLSDIGNIIEREKIDNYGFYIDNADDKTSILYVNSIEPDDMTIISPFIGVTIFIENKII